MRKLSSYLAVLTAFLLLAGCTPARKEVPYVFPESPVAGESQDPSVSEDPSSDASGDASADPSGDASSDPSTGPVVAGTPCFIWIDAAANSRDFFFGTDKIRTDLEKAADAGFTHLIVDVRPTNGDILYKSSHCDQVAWLGAWTSSGYKKQVWDQSYDYLQTFIDIGHELGMKVYAGFNTFVAGNKNSLGNQGIVFRDTKMAALATQLNTDDGIKSAMDIENEIFFNPVHEDVQAYLIDLLKDLAAYGETGLDGIILDRGRFQGYRSDFSDYTRKKFEAFIGQTVTKWPEDVLPKGFKWDYDKGTGVPTPVPAHYKRWNEFRAKTIHDFMVKAREAVKGVDPDVDFGAYVGGWYGSYYENGVNWASPEYNTAGSYPSWATAAYKDYGYADHMDVLVIGAYASPARVFGSSEWTMQGFCKLAYNKVKGATMVVGGPDVGNWSTDGVTKNEEYEAIEKSVKACADACDGYFLFDMIHLKMEPLKWNAVKRGIAALNQ